MPIEFACGQCQKLLRVPDTAAGKNAKCPQCSAVVPVPTSAPMFPGSVPTAPVFPQAPPPPPSAASNPFGNAGGVDGTNPYASPTGDVGGVLIRERPRFNWRVADVGSRFVGALIDGLCAFVAIIPSLIVLGVVAAVSPNNEPADEAAVLFYGVMFLGLIILAVIQMYYITIDGQSLGKKVAKTRIILLNGKLPGFGAGVVLRAWVPQIIGAIPCVGHLFGLIDLIMIFPDQHRTLRDMIAGTIVVDASYDPRKN